MEDFMKLVKKVVDPSQSIYQLKITLHEGEPEIWRTVLVPGLFHLEKLHQVIQIAMGWTNSHLHEFEIDGKRYINPEYDLDEFDTDYPKAINTKRMKLIDIEKNIDHFEYRYDFGDGWRHKIKIEKILLKAEEFHYPICLEGAGACPPEDCGGMGGYGELLEHLKNSKHKEHRSTLRWLGGQFDPHSFDPNRVNRDGLWQKRW